MSLALRQVHFIENYHSGVLDLEQEVSESIANGRSLPFTCEKRVELVVLVYIRDEYITQFRGD